MCTRISFNISLKAFFPHKHNTQRNIMFLFYMLNMEIWIPHFVAVHSFQSSLCILIKDFMNIFMLFSHNVRECDTIRKLILFFCSPNGTIRTTEPNQNRTYRTEQWQDECPNSWTIVPFVFHRQPFIKYNQSHTNHSTLRTSSLIPTHAYCS